MESQHILDFRLAFSYKRKTVKSKMSREKERGIEFAALREWYNLA